IRGFCFSARLTADHEILPIWRGTRLYKLIDGGGLFVEVSPTGQKAWRFQYRFAGRFEAQRARSDGPARGEGVTARSIGATVPARAPTARLMALSVRRCSAESAAIEDIPSSMRPKGTRNERESASPLQLRHVSRYRLQLWLPASRRADRRRLQPAMPMRYAMPVRKAVPMRRRSQLRPSLNRFIPRDAGGLRMAAAGTLTSRVDPSPLAPKGTCP
ncbi:MAG: Arm DNA-binding domain-containing protein, partial [Rubrivivax sp.]|nr:Arm DNA-binding domain-containing protein [Rubrivivax sp.]